MNEWVKKIFEGLLIEFVTKLISLLFPAPIPNVVVLGIGTVLTGLIVFRNDSVPFQRSPTSQSNYPSSPSYTPDLNSTYENIKRRPAAAFVSLFLIALASYFGVSLFSSPSVGSFYWVPGWLVITAIFIAVAIGVWKRMFWARGVTFLLAAIFPVTTISMFLTEPDTGMLPFIVFIILPLFIMFCVSIGDKEE